MLDVIKKKKRCWNFLFRFKGEFLIDGNIYGIGGI